jgi:hypothetical protein
MSKHLSGDVLTELAETGRSHAHLAQCDRCRRQLEDAREALALARAVDVPEPSPLFWAHFSARVRDGVDREAEAGARATASWFARLGWRPVAAVALGVACIVVALWLTPSGRRDASLLSASVGKAGAHGVATGVADREPQAGGSEMLEPANDPSWTVIAQVAPEVEIENSMSLRPGATDSAVTQLSADEQQAFVRLLQTDLDGPPSL